MRSPLVDIDDQVEVTDGADPPQMATIPRHSQSERTLRGSCYLEESWVPPRQRSVEPVTGFDPAALQRARAARGLTLDRLAEMVGANRPQIIGYEQGRAAPGMDTFFALAQALEVEPLELMTATLQTATLADLRARRGLAKAALAQRLDVSPATWDAIERGRRPLRADLQARAARLLGVDPDELAAAHRRGLERRADAAPDDQDPGWLRTRTQITGEEG